MLEKETLIGNYTEKRTIKTDAGSALQYLSGMQCSTSSGKNNPGTLRLMPLGPGRHTQKSQSSRPGNSCPSWKTGTQTADHSSRPISKSLQTAGRNQGCPCGSGPRARLVKKKDELGIKGPFKGHYRVEVKRAMVTAVHESITQGLTQKQACEILG